MNKHCFYKVHEVLKHINDKQHDDYIFQQQNIQFCHSKQYKFDLNPFFHLQSN